MGSKKWMWALIKFKFNREIINNGEKCGLLKQIQAADEKHDSNN